LGNGNTTTHGGVWPSHGKEYGQVRYMGRCLKGLIPDAQYVKELPIDGLLPGELDLGQLPALKLYFKRYR
jgi:hypothetical protein